MSQDCGGCRYWWKAKPEGYGICERFDYRCNSDDGKTCPGFQPPKYSRTQAKREIQCRTSSGSDA